MLNDPFFWFCVFLAYCMGTLVRPLSDLLIRLYDKWRAKK